MNGRLSAEEASGRGIFGALSRRLEAAPKPSTRVYIAVGKHLEHLLLYPIQAYCLLF